ncbi:putative membrane-anchored protein [Sinobaca qinghaiensis]|uniref:Putative membrane-anchored protein n=1 Tax=Sinobaca qinghaiensis TaxID=342944 RepID=A0A419UWS5_9BACL|nr:DUF1129 family protein [Sinobaca qinghaiensis]RKD69593.1 putative membrane-anchored protein [Sinobaca qinghaiensis]
MNTLVDENNEKREQLNVENKKVYEDMLVYVRLSFDKSEAETEEVLMELLDHLLILQEEGRDSRELFGSDPKQYAREIVGELPQALPKKVRALFMMGICYFLGFYLFTSGLIQTILAYGFHHLEQTKTYSLGTTIVGLIMGVAALAILAYSVFRYIQWSCFRHTSKIKEYILSGLMFAVFPGVIVLAMYLWLPSFGPTVVLPVYWMGIVGVVFLIMAKLLGRKI